MSYFIDPHTIDEIREQTDIVSVIGRYVDLKKAGQNYKGLCPFHSERTPSFTVSPQKKIYKCFGCGEGGSVINFIMSIDGLSFPEAARQLASEVGIQIDSPNEYDRKKREHKELLYSINRLVAYHYLKNLRSNEDGIEYVNKRGINGHVINKFGLGYAKDSWDDVKTLLEDEKIDLDIAVEAGVLGKSDSGRYYDFFRNRLIFPIIDPRSRVIGFGGRIINDDMPKYLNTGETPIYHKGSTLYGLNLLKRHRKVPRLILVEGYMDVIGLESKGIQGVIASLGTALTVDQAKLIMEYTDNVYISYDGDNAGKTAATKSVEIFHSINYNPKVVILEDGLDPEEFINKYGEFKYNVAIKNAQDGYNYLIDRYSEQQDLNTVEGRANQIRYIANLSKNIESPIERELQIKKIADDYNISVDVIITEVFGHKQRNVVANENRDNRTSKEYTTGDKGFIELIRILLNNDLDEDEILSNIDINSIDNINLKELYRTYKIIPKDQEFDKTEFLSYLKHNFIIDDILYTELNSNTKEFYKYDLKKVINELINKINKNDKKSHREDILKRINILDSIDRSEEEDKELNELLIKLMEYNK